MMAPTTAGAVSSPFASSVQTTPQAWGAAGADVPQQMIQPGQPQNIAAPAMAPAMVPQQGMQQPVYQQPTFQQPVVPQSGTYAAPAPAAVQPQPTAPPMLAPTPSLKPIPELQRTPAANGTGSAATTAPTTPVGPGITAPMMQPYRAPAIGTPAPSLAPMSGTGTGGTSTTESNGMPVLPGGGPNPATGAFPKLLEPTGHTTSWQPTTGWHPSQMARPTGYPTASLPGRVQ
jgi:hypothetical protein